MNKLLLLATSLISLLIRDFASATPQTNPLNDTTSLQIRIDQKNAFKDLFETEEMNGMDVSKLNPKAVSFVQDYMEENTDKLMKMKERSKPYFDLMSRILTQKGLPTELKYLAVIESDLKTNAVSWAGAVGPWQIMPATARLLGLKVNGKIDERRDFTKSTHAAAKYLAELYDIFEDWLLVIAAYNGGPGKVQTAIRKSGSKNFWNLQYHLPAESRTHVKKFIATQYIMEGDGGVTTLTKAETVKYGLADQTTSDASLSVIKISGKYHSQAIANELKMSINEFSKLNPNFDKQLGSTGNYDLRLPNDKMNLFQLSKNNILDQSIRILLSI